jgi:hypothetical protein
MARLLPHPRLSALAVVAAALALGACAGDPSTTGPGAPRFHTLPDDPFLLIRSAHLCKVGTAATFEVSVNGGAAVTHDLANGECRLVHEFNGGFDDVDTITVTELVPTGVTLDSIVKDSTHGELRITLPAILGTNTASGIAMRSKGVIFTFYNSDGNGGGGQGCTPGYWKQPHHFDSWVGYSPDQLFSSVFENAFPGRTLLQVLEAGGGGLTALGRHTVAALLNASSGNVSYDMSVTDVINAFNAAFPGSTATYNAQKNIFEGLNEQGCPLN